jgi:spore coat polysaccharide biosynthesis protein SpsF
MPESKKQYSSRSVMAFLQARMGSTRLPGKVLMRIRGKSILERAIARLRASPIVDDVAVLTTTLPEDNAIVEEACRYGARIYRGPEHDVLRRFQEASEEFGPEIVIRATADNPLIDIGSIGRIVGALQADGLDLSVESELPYGAATEALTAAALTKAHLQARDPHDREHVTLYIKNHPEEFRVALLMAPECLRQPWIRVTVDTREDLAYMDRLIGSLPEANGQIHLQEYIPFAMSIFEQRECKALPLS